MIKNYLRVALRNFRKNLLFASISALGLAIGISAALVIYLIVRHELTIDTFHQDKDRIYRVVTEYHFADMVGHNCGVPVPTAKALKEEGTGLEEVVHFQTQDMDVSVPLPGVDHPASFKKKNWQIFCDDGYFRLIPYRWIAGSSSNALEEPYHVVLARSRASTYFPGVAPENIVGRQLLYDDSITVTVSGIVADLEEPTDFLFKEFISRSTVDHSELKKYMNWDGWTSTSSASQLFVKLLKGTNPANVEQQIAELRKKYVKKENGGEDDTKNHLQALPDIHFNRDYSIFNPSGGKGNKTTLYGLLSVAGFLLLLGCINFVNLSTAQATRRAKEIGIRKTMGGTRDQLVTQFLGETFVLTVAAALASLVLVPLLLDIFKDYIPEGVGFASLMQPHVWVFLGVTVLVVSALSGIYPGLVLTRFQPVAILRNQIAVNSSTSHKAWLRRILTVTQFVIAQFLIIATIVVSKQVVYSLNKDLGYNREAIVYFRTPLDYFSAEKDKRRFVLEQQLRQIPGIARISLAGNPPASNNTSSSTLKVNNGKEAVEKMIEIKTADTSYFALYGLKLVAGRELTQSDTVREYLINEAYARVLGLAPEEVLNRVVDGRGGIPIVGVVRDFHTKSTQQPIKPLAFTSEQKYASTFHLALSAGNPSTWKPTLEKVGAEFQKIYPDQEFHSEFFDESIAAFYKKEEQVSRLLNWAAGLAILISCLGLLGLVIYTTNARVKEIGVRKVLGASVLQIISLLSKDFLSLVLAAFVIAAPLGWWAMNRWLEDYAYRTNLSWWVFAATGVLMTLLALITLSIRTFKSASENPVHSLRSE